MGKVNRALIIVVKKLAEERKVNIVLPKSVVVWAAKTLDISELALKRLNKKLPSIKVVVKVKK